MAAGADLNCTSPVTAMTCNQTWLAALKFWSCFSHPLLNTNMTLYKVRCRHAVKKRLLTLPCQRANMMHSGLRGVTSVENQKTNNEFSPGLGHKRLVLCPPRRDAFWLLSQLPLSRPCPTAHRWPRSAAHPHSAGGTGEAGGHLSGVPQRHAAHLTPPVWSSDLHSMYG